MCHIFYAAICKIVLDTEDGPHLEGRHQLLYLSDVQPLNPSRQTWPATLTTTVHLLRKPLPGAAAHSRYIRPAQCSICVSTTT